MTLMAEELDGQDVVQMTKAFGKVVDHAIGRGMVIEPKPGVFAIQIDMECDYRGCDTLFEARLYDGPSTGDWAYAVIVATGERGDLRNHVIFCDEHAGTGRMRGHSCEKDDPRPRPPYGYRVRKGETEDKLTSTEGLLLSLTEHVSDWLVEQDEFDGADTLWDEGRESFVVKLHRGSVR